MKTEIPLHKHDCNKCIYLGQYVCQYDKTWDLYVCLENIQTVVARYGNRGGEYLSGMCFAKKDGVPELYEAKLRAIKKGILK